MVAAAGVVPLADETAAPSLLSITLQRLSEHGRTATPINRIFLAGACAEGVKPEEVAALHEEAFAGADVTGLLLLLPTGWIEMVEGVLPSLSELLAKLSASPSVAHVKVVGHTEDIPGRSFAYFSSKALDVQRGNFAELGDSKDPAKVEQAVASMLADTQIGFIKVQQLIFEERVLDLADFMALYEAPVDTQMHSAMVWPPDRPLIY